jgi:hypothetical protein
MSRITGKPVVAPLNPWTNISTGNSNQAYGATPANGANPTSGTGILDSSFSTYVGQKFDTADGRELVLVANGGVALTPSVVVQAPAQITTALGLAMTVPTAYPATAGLYQIYATNSSTVLSANQFQGGYCIVASGTGLGQIFKIASHTAGTNAGAVVINLEDPIQTTLDATSTLNLVYNSYGGGSASAAGAVSNGVIISTGTTATSGPIGVTLYGIAASTAPTYNTTSGALSTAGTVQYGLIVCHGPTACKVDTITTVGSPVAVSTAVTGAVSTGIALPAGALIGHSMQTLVSAKYGLIYLDL